ncbi:hypothetical protein MP638_005975 [Amoeboaphelidium occidentale]|nr:hypothetical protein MP638_005975 [Amoeboaphelidium occidentale]
MVDENDSDDFFFKDGLRHVKPYTFQYHSYAKRRWLGKKLLDVFKEELVEEHDTFFQEAISEGRVQVNGKNITLDYQLKDLDYITHTIVRDEPPVLADEIEVVYEDEHIIVVSKPSSMPVHSCGRYHKNCVLYILEAKLERKLFLVHRLDRLTSGIVMFAKDNKTAQEICKSIVEGNVEKVYYALVDGKFRDEVTIDQPLKTIMFKSSINMVAPDGKESVTHYKRIHFDGKHSLVECRPVTGRSHQIRVHLRWLGFPIVNDDIYRDSKIWGECDSADIITEEEIIERCADIQDTIERTRKSMGICLHAIQYRYKDLVFRSKPPSWANLCEDTRK